MATVTPNFNWPVPTSTDLVKDGATAIEALGDSIDASLVDLKGGTTGQVLSKTSNTDMDFTWVAQDDSNAIQNAIVDAKGDLIAASAADTPARLAVGNNGETLVADSSTSTGLRWQGDYAAGKNKFINGDFGIWQRGTTTNLTTSTNAILADRFNALVNFSAGTASLSRQTFTPGDAPVAGSEGIYFQRINTGTTATYLETYQRIENVQTFAGQTVTFSFWAKASGALTVKGLLSQNYGSGGSTSTNYSAGSFALTTSWVRYSQTVNLNSISGKTIGAGSYLVAYLYQDTGALGGLTFDTWGWQLEQGSVATAFQTATGTIQGELAACQRYFYRLVNGTSQCVPAPLYFETTSAAVMSMGYPVVMRTAASITATASNFRIGTHSGTFTNCNSLAVFDSTPQSVTLVWGTATAPFTLGASGRVNAISSGSPTLDFSAEL